MFKSGTFKTDTPLSTRTNAATQDMKHICASCKAINMDDIFDRKVKAERGEIHYETLREYGKFELLAVQGACIDGFPQQDAQARDVVLQL
jgi:hypothetical protein